MGGDLAHMGETTNAHKNLGGNPKRRYYSEYLGVSGV